ncbi:UNVERIFIED_CONTAM: hypothetical protein FKN15_025251 [Acipenser sinensis]
MRKRNSPWRFCFPNPNPPECQAKTSDFKQTEHEPVLPCMTPPVHLVAMLLPGQGPSRSS